MWGTNSSLGPLLGAQPSWHLHLRVPVFRTLREHIPIVLSHHAGSNLFQQPQEVNTVTSSGPWLGKAIWRRVLAFYLWHNKKYRCWSLPLVPDTEFLNPLDFQGDRIVLCSFLVFVFSFFYRHINRHRDQTYGHGEGGERVRCMEIVTWKLTFNSVQFSHSVVSNSLQLHKLQHARPPCPSPTRSPLKPMSIKSMMPSNHLILCHPLLLLPSIFPSIRVFSNESALRTR